jgi:DNA replication and repair protein RecF
MREPGRVSIGTLSVSGFRNLEPTTLTFGDGTNLVHGRNGHGKTSLLEAIYVAATTRSFRVSKLRDCLRFGAPGFRLRLQAVEQRGDLAPLARSQEVTWIDRILSARVDDNRTPSAAAYAVLTPVVVFHPDELALSTGPAELRRKLIDRVALFGAPLHARRLAEYTRALRARQELLRSGRGSDVELDAYEAVLADKGLALAKARRDAVLALAPRAGRAFASIAAEHLSLELRYAGIELEDPDAYRRALHDARASDARAPTARFGPHRDDLTLSLDGRPARKVASQGQHRAITLALKAGESSTVRAITDLEPVQLLDDVSSELDADRTRALFRFLGELRGQVFVSTARPDLIQPLLTRENMSSFHVVEGTVSSP